MEEWPSLLDESAYETSRVWTADEAVARIRRETSAFKLCMRGASSKIGDDVVKAIAQELRDNNTCVGLYLSENGITNVGAQYLAEIIPHSRLKELVLSSNKISNDGMRALATAMRGSSLTALRICYQRIYENIDEGFVSIAESLKDTNLTVLDMSIWDDYVVGEASVKALCDALPESRVQELRLRRVHVGLQYLPVVLPQTVLTYLDLVHNSLDDEFVHLLADALPLSRLEALNLGLNLVTAVGAGHLARVLPATNIWYLNIGWNEIGDAGLQSLCEALPNSSIRRLVLHVTSVSDVGLHQLLDVGKSLIALDFHSNSITDVGAQYIADFLIEEDINVEVVNLRFIRGVTDVGGRTLVEAMKRCRIVTKMDINYTQISDAVGSELDRWVDVNRALKEKDREACALCLELNQMEVFRTGLPRLMIVRIAIFAVGGVATPDGELLYANEDNIMLFLSAQ